MQNRKGRICKICVFRWSTHSIFVKCRLFARHKGVWVNVDVTPVILKLDTRSKCMVIGTPRPLYPSSRLLGPRNQSVIVIPLQLCIDRCHSIPVPLTVHLRPLFLFGIQCNVDVTGRHSVVFRRVTYHASWRAATNRCRQLRVGLCDTTSRQPVFYLARYDVIQHEAS